MMRSLLNVAVGKPEMIGTFEQVNIHASRFYEICNEWWKNICVSSDGNLIFVFLT